MVNSHDTHIILPSLSFLQNGSPFPHYDKLTHVNPPPFPPAQGSMVWSSRALLHGAVATYLIRNLRRHRHHDSQANPDLVCNIPLPLRWEARNGELLVHDQVFHLKVRNGGMESEVGCIDVQERRRQAASSISPPPHHTRDPTPITRG